MHLTKQHKVEKTYTNIYAAIFGNACETFFLSAINFLLDLQSSYSISSEWEMIIVSK